MLQLLLGGFTQAVIDYTIHIAGAALVQILFSNFAITIIAADFQLVHAVRMLGEQMCIRDNYYLKAHHFFFQQTFRIFDTAALI